jgi:hypothetical protein
MLIGTRALGDKGLLAGLFQRPLTGKMLGAQKKTGEALGLARLWSSSF